MTTHPHIPASSAHPPQRRLGHQQVVHVRAEAPPPRVRLHALRHAPRARGRARPLPPPLVVGGHHLAQVQVAQLLKAGKDQAHGAALRAA